MKNRRLVRGAAAALTVAGVVVAQAADLPMRQAPPPPLVVPPSFTWTGFYIGANIGGLWNGGDFSSSYVGLPVVVTSHFPTSLGGGSIGVLGGGQAGFNWQTGAMVFGLETDIDGTSASRSKNYVSPTFNGPGNAPDFATWNGSTRLDWIGTTRLRAGFVATPDNRLMLYGTGGFAYGGGNANLDFYDHTGLAWSGARSSTRTGWTLGAGAEYAITDHITLKGEYLYYSLGNSNTVAVPNNPAIAAGFPNWSGTARVNFDGSIFRAGMNYKF
jgi:outer membrane immunogenic protein